MSYEPSPKTAEMLDYALEKIKALPYEVSARWAFYRLVQGFPGYGKDAYRKFLQLTAKARKSFWNGWTPDTLVDDTREILNEYGTGFTSPLSWFEAQARKKPKLEVAEHFDTLPVVMFEAKAMTRQFKYYLDPFRIPLCAFGGDPSIHYKWEIAAFLNKLQEKWPDKEITVLYFGDYDPKGEEIPENAIRDIRLWCSAPFDFDRIGINWEHIEQFNITESPNEPGHYQWEALEDDAARGLIIGAIEDYWDLNIVKALKRIENKTGDTWSEKVRSAIKAAKKAIEEEELEFPDADDEEEEVE